MTNEQRQEIERLDRWLAVQEVTGRRFAVGYGVACAMNVYTEEHHEGSSYLYGQKFIGAENVCALFFANDHNNGSPGAVRAKLHRLFPFLTETPAPTEVPSHV